MYLEIITQHALALGLELEVNHANNLDVQILFLINSPLIFVLFTSNFLRRCFDRVVHVILMQIGQKLMGG